MDKPNKLSKFMYGMMKEARRNDFSDFLENWNISWEEYEEIKEWFKSNKIEL